MSPITTHVLDTALGRPAAGIAVVLEVQAKAVQPEAVAARTVEAGGGTWRAIGHGVTDQEGRITDFLAAGKLEAGTYRLTFDTAAYFGRGDRGGRDRQTVFFPQVFFPQICVVFTVDDAAQHYHVPLLLSPFGYSTYRGS